MKQITVKNQEEFDKIQDQKEETNINVEIKNDWLIIKKVPANCFVVARDSSHVVARDSSHVEAWEWVTVNKKKGSAKVIVRQNAVVVDETKEIKFEAVKDWLLWWDLKPERGKVVMFKAVSPGLNDFYTGKINYAVGNVVECPDWIEDYPDECGHGLHCSPQLFLTHKYARPEHVHVKVQVNVEDIRLPKGPFIMIDKVRVKKLKVLEVIE